MPDASFDFDEELLREVSAPAETGGVISTDAFLEDIAGGEPDFSGGLTDELSALTGLGRPGRPTASVNKIPEPAASGELLRQTRASTAIPCSESSTASRACRGSAYSMQSVKVVVTGPFNAGKTTFIKAVSEITVLSTERQISDTSTEGSGETTVAMDFGRITVSTMSSLYLFGTPGQSRFSFMWETLSEGMLGFVLIVDAMEPQTLEDARGMIEFFTEMSDVPFVVAANKVAAEDVAQLQQVRADLALDPSVPLLSVDARDRDSVKSVLLGLLYEILESMENVTMDPRLYMLAGTFALLVFAIVATVVSFVRASRRHRLNPRRSRRLPRRSGPSFPRPSIEPSTRASRASRSGSMPIAPVPRFWCPFGLERGAHRKTRLPLRFFPRQHSRLGSRHLPQRSLHENLWPWNPRQSRPRNSRMLRTQLVRPQ